VQARGVDRDRDRVADAQIEPRREVGDEVRTRAKALAPGGAGWRMVTLAQDGGRWIEVRVTPEGGEEVEVIIQGFKFTPE
jgi:uncharacterized iron-regulated membrane protein